MSTRLIYVHDPMCSWCWGFEPVRRQLFEKVPKELKIIKLLGGLASDSDKPMPNHMQVMLQKTWKKIQHTIPKTEFNYDFWEKCHPRRSTYPSNRAIIAARLQGEEFDNLMTLGIQQAYYLDAKNPSDNSTLIEITEALGLNVKQFTKDLNGDKVQEELIEEISVCRKLGLTSFPSLAIKTEKMLTTIAIDYLNVENILGEIDKKLKK